MSDRTGDKIKCIQSVSGVLVLKEELALVVVKHDGHRLDIVGITLGRKVCKKTIAGLAVEVLREYEALIARNLANNFAEPVGLSGRCDV